MGRTIGLGCVLGAVAWMGWRIYTGSEKRAGAQRPVKPLKDGEVVRETTRFHPFLHPVPIAVVIELDEVEIASADSFPASDAPSWTPLTGIAGHERA
jgi:hypothetical protein